MIDYFALALTHALIVIALLRIVARPDLDSEDVAPALDAEEEEPRPAPATPRAARRARRAKGGGDA